MTEVVIDWDIYPRNAVSDATVAKYAALMGEGVKFPPIIVERGTGRLFDGMHRYRASDEAGVELEVEEHDVPEGSTPIAYAALLNQGHGLPMRESDLQSIAVALFDAGATVAETARNIGVARTTVQDWVAPLLERRRAEEQRLRDVRNIGFRLLSDAGWTQQRIADHHGLTKGLVSQVFSDDDFVATKHAALVWEAVATYAPLEPAVSYIASQWLNPSKPHVSNNSGENEWYTPPEFIKAAHKVFADYGGIELDPASSEVANGIVNAARYFTAKDDGLSQKWDAQTVWLNPPYSSDLIGKFIDKTCAEVDSGRIKAAIVLVNNATETKWAQQLMSRAHRVCFPSGRIKYLDRDGAPANTPLQGQMFALLIPERLVVDCQVEGVSVPVAEAFDREFGTFGEVLSR